MKERFKVVLTILIVTALFVGAFAFVLYKLEEKNTTRIRVGYIYVGDGSTTYTENYMNAQKMVEEEYGNRVESVVFYNVSESSIADLYDDILAADLDIVFSTSYGYQFEVKKWAAQNPDIQFCQATGDNANTDPLPNYHNYMGTIYEGRYVTGVLAGAKLKELISQGKLKPEDAKIGYIAAYPYAEVISGYTAFLLGVRSQVENATMEVVYVNTWSDYAMEKQMAEMFIDRGCTIISQHSDTMGTAVACQNRSDEKILLQVGYNGSMVDIGPTTSIASCKINWGYYEVQAVGAVLAGKDIEKSIKGKTNGKDSWGGLREGWVEIVGVNDFITAKGSDELLEETIAQLRRGKINVFSGNYTGTNPFDPDDKIDLSKAMFVENKEQSSPSFNYVLDDIITIIDAE